MTFKIGDDGEIIYDELSEKPKRKRKGFARRGLEGCALLFFAALFFVFGSIGGFASYFIRNPNTGVRYSQPSNTCTSRIEMIAVGGASVLFANPNGRGRIIQSIDGHSSGGIDRPGKVDSLSLSADEQHIVETRYETIAPYFFIYSWEQSNFAQWNEHLLTDGKYPSWSPDMKQIAFFRFSGYDRSRLYVMNADGSNVRLVRLTYFVNAPASWSPDGTQLIFSTSDFKQQAQNIYRIDLKSGAEDAIVKTGLTAQYPAWSPDGKSIAYVSRDIYSINLDGSNRHNVTNSKFSYITNLGWSPDSQSLVFLAQDTTISHTQAIYIMDRDGSGLHTIYSPCPR